MKVGACCTCAFTTQASTKVGNLEVNVSVKILFIYWIYERFLMITIFLNCQFPLVLQIYKSIDGLLSKQLLQVYY